MQPLHREELLGTFPVFLLEILWEGFTYRFASFGVEVASLEGSIYFGGGLNDPELEEKMDSIQADPESGSIAIEVVFPVDLVQKYMEEGKSLESATAELSMVLEIDGAIIQSYEDRIKLFSGVVIQPIIGDPEQPTGYATFSIERNPLNAPKTLIPASWRIELGITFAASPEDIGQSSYGKIYSFVFGQAKEYPIQNKIFATPAYIIRRDRSSIHTTDPRADIIDLMIAGHDVEATAVEVVDFAGNTDTFNVLKSTDLLGQIYSYIRIQPYSYVAPTYTKLTDIVTPFMEGNTTSNPEYWISWSGGGAFPNPYGAGSLSGGGDLILYMLSTSGVLVDLDSWNNIAQFLNAFIFAGYINDPEITSYEWIMTNIVEYLPVEIVNGFNGLRGVIPLYYKSTYIQPRINIELGSGAYLISAFEPINESDDIINRLQLKFAYNAVSKEYATRYNLNSSLQPENYTYIDTNIESALLSHTRYGDRYTDKEALFVYDFRTAGKICTYLVRKNAFLKIGFSILADVQFGYLDIGDVVSIQSAKLYMDSVRVQIISKIWSDNSWIFGLVLEDNISMRQKR
jgi:hypothetical protein